MNDDFFHIFIDNRRLAPIGRVTSEASLSDSGRAVLQLAREVVDRVTISSAGRQMCRRARYFLDIRSDLLPKLALTEPPSSNHQDRANPAGQILPPLDDRFAND